MSTPTLDMRQDSLVVQVDNEAAVKRSGKVANVGGGAVNVLAGMTDANILVAIDGPIATIALNRPARHNAIALAMWTELPNIVARLAAYAAVRAIILHGTGGTFSAGADIAEFAAVRASVAQGEAYEQAVDACSDAIQASEKPLIAAIDGFCLGGGCHLAMACDFRFLSPAAKLGIPAARLSIVYGVRSTARLLSLVGLPAAKRILFSGEQLTAEEALRLGLGDRIDVDPLAAARAFAANLAENAPLSIAGAKLILNGLAMGTDTLDLETAERAILAAVGSEDYTEGRQAFAEKRRPVFRGS